MMSDVRSDLTEYMYDPFTIQGLELSIPKEDESTERLISRAGLSASSFKINMSRENFDQYIS
jgi:hypothetical protein